jgi:pyruvate dehydrogenase E2 component (dihydrolipoamide acetyltransferase)
MEIKLPALGENVEEARVVKVLVKKGDSVQKDQPVLEMESEKAAFEVPAPQAGRVSEVHVSEGAKVKVGQTILTLEEDGAGARGEQKEKEPEKHETAGPAAATQKSERTRAKPESPPPKRQAEASEPEAEPSKTKAESPKEHARPARKDEPAPPREDGEKRPPEEAGERHLPEESDAGRPGQEPLEARQKEPREVPAAGPATRRLAREMGVDLAQVRGTEAGGRITPEDVKAYVRERGAGGQDRETGPAPDFERWGPTERRPLGSVEKAASRHLSDSWRQIPHVTHHDVADVTELEEARERYESGRKPSEPKLTVTALAVKAVVAALGAFPRFNASLDLAREQVVLKQYVHVGVAVDTEHGLLVPVVRDADRKTTREIAAEIAGLAERARQRKLLPEEMQGASFTVSNLGGIGGTGFSPIVSFPEVAILGLSRTREELALRGGQVVRRVLLPLSLSYDHRVNNGADAARFVRHLAGLLEDPLHLLIES